MSAFFDEARWAAFLRARQRRALAIERGCDECYAEVVFREHFVGQDERATSDEAMEAVEREGVAKPLALRGGKV